MTQICKPDARTWAEIDMAALKNNFSIAKNTGKKVMCVIKANAYGHGAVRCGLFLQRHGADAFAVACLEEALELRRAGVGLPILILGYTPPQEAEQLAEYDIQQTVTDDSYARQLNAEAKQAGVCVPVHVKIDTGMSRIGLYAQNEEAAIQAAGIVKRISNLPDLKVEGMYTHFAAADTRQGCGFTRRQTECFQTIIDQLERSGLRPALCHAGNSAAILHHPEADFDMVRAGIMLYGLYPDSVVPEAGLLRTVMTLKSRVVQVRRVPAGTTVSYGCAYRCRRTTDLAVVAAGYADGYARRLSGKTKALVDGAFYPQVGRICMDMHMIDVTGSKGGVHVGDEASLWGASGLRTEEAARIIGTINYELTCRITGRVPRVYLHEDI